MIWLSRVYQAAVRLLMRFIHWPAPVVLEGEGSVLRLPERLIADGVHKPLVITGPTLHRLGTVNGLLQALDAAGIPAAVFDRVANDPTIANVEDALATYQAGSCDAIIAFGGGSPMDCAKLCAARVARPQTPVRAMRGMLRVRRALPPLYAVPTTSGTGSEVTVAAVVTDEQHRKYAVTDFVLVPRVAVLDPTLTYGMPAGVTAASGMDALCHAVEAYIGQSNTKQTRADALIAVQQVYRHLPTAYRDGQNAAARAGMQQAAYYAGLAFTRAYVGYVHALAHAVGGRYGLAHGVACAILMPATLRAYGPAALPQLAALAIAAGVAQPTDAVPVQAEAFLQSLEALNRELGLPAALEPLQKADIPLLAAQAANEGNLTYPAPKVLQARELASILQSLLPANNETARGTAGFPIRQ